MNKRCIFHIPNALDKEGKSASHIRPKKMKEAFENIGYKVDAVWGTARERRKQIREIKHNIKMGMKYDFMYSESSTMPTLLTESHHLPTHPFLDFSFFDFVKEHEIKIGLFYRDMYWKFPIYKEGVKGIKYYAAISMYIYDLYKYNQLLTKLYLPTSYCAKYIKKEIKAAIIDCLPPACEKHNQLNRNDNESNQLNLLYIGGIGNQYKIHEAFKAVSTIENVMLTVCCREDEWKTMKPEYEFYMSPNIKIVHKSGKELGNLYQKADISLMLFEDNAYMKMAAPYKMFEYLSYGKPIISSSRTAAGKFVKENNIGWSIEYSMNALIDLLSYLQEHPDEINKKKSVCIEKTEDNTWEKRAEKVVIDLMEKDKNG